MSLSNIEKLKSLLEKIKDCRTQEISSVFWDYRSIVSDEHKNHSQLWGCMSEFSDIEHDLKMKRFGEAREHIEDDIRAAIGIIEYNAGR